MRKSVIKYGETVQKAKNLINQGVPIIVFDLETTGLSSIEDRVLSFSAIKAVKNNNIFVVIDEKNIFINPEREIRPETSSVNHIYNDTVKDCPNEDGVIGEIKEFFGDSPFVCGYNSTKFDEKFMNQMYLRTLGEEFKPQLHVDVIMMAKEKIESKSHKLSDIADLMGVSNGLEFHNSLDDVYATFRVLKMLLEEYEEEEKKPLYQLRVKKASLYRPSHKVNRIYIATYPYSKTFFDLYKKEWQSDMDCDIDFLEHEVLDMYQVPNIQALGRKLANA